jgi:hypothetical protein
LDSQAYEAIDITGTLDASWTHREGVMKLHDGARFVYHQKAVGPSRYEVFDSHVQAAFGLRSDVTVTKQVAPVHVATYDDSVYHFIKLEDPWEPRCFNEDPFIQSYGFGDIAATVYVGGRHQRELLWSSVSPGGATQIRVEINNNTGVTMTNLSLIPEVPPGVTVTLRTYTETTQIEPLFFDFPFLNATEIGDAWKGVYYFDVEVADPFPGERGIVYPITFTLTGDNIPSDFRIPPAQLGIKNNHGKVYTVYGTATELEVTDRLPPWVTLRDVRLANATEVVGMVDAINYDDANPGSDTAGALYGTLRGGVTTSTITSTLGTDVTFTLPEDAQRMPWLDSGQVTRTLYVILYSDLAIDWSGTAIADHAPDITYVDSFSQTQSATGNEETVEAHGAVLEVDYVVRQPDAPIPVGASTDVVVEGTLVNVGDDIAGDAVVTYSIPSDVVPQAAIPAWSGVTSDTITWQLGDIGPGVRRTLWITLTVTTTPLEAGTQRMLIETADGRFLNVFAQRYASAQIGDELTVAVGRNNVFLPLVMSDATVLPDLVVRSVTATTDDVQVVIENVGLGTVTDEFWVDVYIDPSPPPTEANEIWNDMCEQGLVWGVTTDLAPGQVLTLTFGDAYYTSTYSAITWPLAEGVEVYAQVDAWNPDTSYGAVLETHEDSGGAYNNVVGPVLVQFDGAGDAAALPSLSFSAAPPDHRYD